MFTSSLLPPDSPRESDVSDTLSDDDVDGITDSMFGNRSREITVELPAVEAFLREHFGYVAVVYPSR